MAEVGSIEVKISAKTRELIDGVNESTRKLQDLGDKVADFRRRVETLGRSMTSVGAEMTKAFTLPIAALGGVALKTSIDFESAFAGVRKTVDATEAELADLREGILEMSKRIPAAQTTIAGVAEAAGQLGIQVPNIIAFTETMVNLGVATNLAAQDAATALARFANIVQMPQTEFDRLGSTIVALGNNLATTEAEIVEMGLRIAGAGAQVGLAEAEILGLAGALSSVGIRAEAGGTAISRVMIEIANEVATVGDNLGALAKVAGMSADEFSRAWQTDAATTLIQFVEGLGRIGGSVDVFEALGDMDFIGDEFAEALSSAGIEENLFSVLEELGFREIRVRDALLRTSGAGDILRNSIELGRQAWEENTALVREAEQRYQTTASQIDLLLNKLKDVSITIGDSLTPILLQLIDAMQPFIDMLKAGAEWFASLDPQMQTAIVTFGALAAAIGPVAVALGTVITALGVLAGPAGWAALGVVGAALGVAFWPQIEEALGGFEGFDKVIDAITEAFKPLKEIMSTVLDIATDVAAAFAPFVEIAWDVFAGTLESAFTILKGVLDVVLGILTGDLATAIDGVETILEGFSTAVDTIMNALEATVKSVLNIIIDAVNAVIRALNTINVRVPDWVPIFGGKEFGFNLSEIPRFELQTGAILPGAGGPDSIPALLAPGEAVTPYSVWSRGPEALVAWFRAMGAPGYQTGGIVGDPLVYPGGIHEPDPRILKIYDVWLSHLKGSSGPGFEYLMSVADVLRELAHRAAYGDDPLSLLREEWTVTRSAVLDRAPAGLRDQVSAVFAEYESPLLRALGDEAEVRAFYEKLQRLALLKKQPFDLEQSVAAYLINEDSNRRWGVYHGLYDIIDALFEQFDIAPALRRDFDAVFGGSWSIPEGAATIRAILDQYLPGTAILQGGDFMRRAHEHLITWAAYWQKVAYMADEYGHMLPNVDRGHLVRMADIFGAMGQESIAALALSVEQLLRDPMSAGEYATITRGLSNRLKSAALDMPEEALRHTLQLAAAAELGLFPRPEDFVGFDETIRGIVTAVTPAMRSEGPFRIEYGAVSPPPDVVLHEEIHREVVEQIGARARGAEEFVAGLIGELSSIDRHAYTLVPAELEAWAAQDQIRYLLNLRAHEHPTVEALLRELGVYDVIAAAADWYLNPPPGYEPFRHSWIKTRLAMGMRRGGILAGFGGGDRIPALLEAGEAVIPKESVAANRGLVASLIGMQDGGIVGGIPGAGGSPIQQLNAAALAVSTVLDRLASRLSEVDRGLGDIVRSLRWNAQSGRLELDATSIITSAITMAFDALWNLASNRAEIERRIAAVPDPGTDILGIAQTVANFRNLESNIAERERRLRELQELQQNVNVGTVAGGAVGLGIAAALGLGPVGLALGFLFGGVAGRKVATDTYGPEIAKTEQQIKELEAQIANARVNLIEALGIAADDFARSIASAFEGADIDEFSERLGAGIRDQIRQAMITAFVAEILEPEITALAEMVQDAFLGGGTLDMELIDARIEGIVEVSRALYERFDELGLTVEKTDRAMQSFSRNIPSGYKIAQPAFQVASGIMPLAGPASAITDGGAKPQAVTVHVPVVVQGPLMGTSEREVKRWIQEAVAEGMEYAGLGNSGLRIQYVRG